MANYDTSVRVNTKVDNSDLKQLQKEFDKLEAKLDSLYKKGDKLEALGVDKQSRQWQSLRYDVAQTEMALEDVRDRIQQVNNMSLGETEGGFTKIKNSSQKCFKTLQEGTKKSNGLLASFASRLKGIALSLLVFNWITKGFNAMVQAMKEGFQNLAHYSSDYNKSMSELKSQTEQLKNGLAAAFEPIANMFIPYLTKLVSWLNIAVDAIAQFFAALQGKSTYTRAKKQAIDYAKSLDKVTNSAKRALASFDELNVLSKNDSAATAGGLSGAAAFEEAKIDPEIYEMLEKVKKLLEIIWPIVVAIGIAFLAWKLAQFLKDLGSVGANLLNAYGIILLIAGLALLVYKYFNMWKNGVDWEGIIGYVAGVAVAVMGLYILFGPLVAGIALIVFSIAGLVLAFKDMTENGFTAENMMLALLSVVELVAGVFMAFGATAAIVVAGVAAIIGAFGALLIWTGNGEEALANLKAMLKDLGDFAKNVFAGDWESAFKSLEDYGHKYFNNTNLAIESFVNGFIKAMNLIIDAINSISISIPDWVPIYGGNSYSPNLSNIAWQLDLPRLANGAVIQGGKPFAAILGDQPAGQTNVETPLSTIEQALQNVYDKNGSSGDIYITATLDGDVVYKNVVKRDKIQRKATGRSGFAF